MKYAIVIEMTGSSCSAYAPDLPGCIATGESIAEVRAEITAAINFHLQGLLAEGFAAPHPTSIVEYIEIIAP